MYAEEFRKTITPHEEYLKLYNINPQQAFDKLLSTEKRLNTSLPHEKKAILLELGRHYGVDLTGIEAPGQIDPMIQDLYDRTTAHTQYLARLEQKRISQEEHGYQSQIDTFANEKDSSGNLKRPHFEDVRKDMGLLIEHGRAVNLEDAYNKAILLNEDLKKEVIRQHARDEDSRKRATASKKASFNVKSASTSRISDPKEHLSIRDSVTRAMEAGNRL